MSKLQFFLLIVIFQSLTNFTIGKYNLTKLILESGKQRIIGGIDVPVTDIPFIVSLRLGDPDSPNEDPYHSCGGSYFKQRWIITAAHCLVEEEFNADEENPLPNVGDETRFTCIMGVSKLSDTKGQSRASVALFAHPKYDSELLNNDVGMVMIEKPFEIGPAVGYAMLIEEKQTYKGRIAMVAGWGRTESEKPVSDTMKMVLLPVLNTLECKPYYENNPEYDIFFKDDRVVCAGYKSGGYDACQGDSGGPLILDETILIGIVSWGIGCGSELPGVYTSVYFYKDYIQETIKEGLRTRSSTSTLLSVVSLVTFLIILVIFL